MRKGGETRRVSCRHRWRSLALVSARAAPVTATPARANADVTISDNARTVGVTFAGGVYTLGALSSANINTAEYKVPKGEHVVTLQATDAAATRTRPPRGSRSR